MKIETNQEKLKRLNEEYDFYRKQFGSSKSFDDIVFYSNMMMHKVKELDKLLEELNKE